MLRLVLLFGVFSILWSGTSLRCQGKDATKQAPAKTTVKQENGELPEYQVRAKILSVKPEGILCTGALKGETDDGFVRMAEPVMIFGAFPKAVDGDRWNGAAVFAGRYQYTAPNKVVKTVRALATTLPIALGKLYPEINGPNELKPPFNLTWGTPPNIMRGLLKGAGATIAKTSEQNGCETFEVNGLVAQSGVKRTAFTFGKDGLSSVLLGYDQPEWTDENYLSYANKLKEVVEKRFGEGAEAPHTDESDPITKEWKWAKTATFMTLVVRKAENNGARIEVVYSTAEHQ